MKQELNTMETLNDGFKIERNGEIITLTPKEMDEFMFLEKAIVGKKCVENYEQFYAAAEEDELEHIQQVKNDKFACNEIEQNILEIL